MRHFLTKLSSRKWQAALALIATGLVMIFTGMGQEAAEGQVQIVAGSLLSIVAAVMYIWRESQLDLAAMKPADDAATEE